MDRLASIYQEVVEGKAQPADENAEFRAKKLPIFNPSLPQFPVGTQVALLREMLVIDNQGKIQPTRLLESIQVRVYRAIPAGDPRHPEGLFDELEGKQDFYEFRATRKDLFADHVGGLHAVGPLEEEIDLFIPPGGGDPFDDDLPARPGTSRIMNYCAGCHRLPEIHSVETYRRGFLFTPQPRPAQLLEHDRAHQEQAAMFMKWENYSWGLLQGLMER